MMDEPSLPLTVTEETALLGTEALPASTSYETSNESNPLYSIDSHIIGSTKTSSSSVGYDADEEASPSRKSVCSSPFFTTEDIKYRPVITIASSIRASFNPTEEILTSSQLLPPRINKSIEELVTEELLKAGLLENCQQIQAYNFEDLESGESPLDSPVSDGRNFIDEGLSSLESSDEDKSPLTESKIMNNDCASPSLASRNDRSSCNKLKTAHLTTSIIADIEDCESPSLAALHAKRGTAAAARSEYAPWGGEEGYTDLRNHRVMNRAESFCIPSDSGSKAKKAIIGEVFAGFEFTAPGLLKKDDSSK